ncbi:Long-chain-fatty-acid--CoA ligase 5 like protein [Argiope bruennichi]|uniref:long-chain-fatty-acid--CoA ligase n=1 Tax=Argiope bruennichi TaxID=94029 RepID=A0A8T0E015_ARGBR|nr:Long-chain-fatty-acid--CoA ligase 5 like protein [Argiope bruennichi]
MFCKTVPCSLLQRCLQEVHLMHMKRLFKGNPSTCIASLESCEKLPEMAGVPPRKQIILKKVECLHSGRKKIKIYPPPSLMSSQSVVLPGPERIRASGVTDNPEKFLEFPDEKTRTICDTVVTGLPKSFSGECLGIRSPLQTGEYKWTSYSELSIKINFKVAERKDYIGSGLLDLGVPHSHEAMIGICTKTRPEFVLVMLACSRYSFVLVPLYHCFGTENMAYIADQVKMEVMFCETPEFAASILKNKELYPHLKQLILFDGSEDEIAVLNSSDLKVMSLKDLEIRGKLNLQKPKVSDMEN